MIVHRCYFFTNRDERLWNIFDFILVILTMWALAVHILAGDAALEERLNPKGHEDGGNRNVAFLRILRLLKVSKILRLFRSLRFFKELGQMVNSFLKSVITL